MNSELIIKIEMALGITFEDWQKDYMLEIPRVLDMRITGRRTGKTLVYILKLLFSDLDKPLIAYDINKIERYSDWFSTSDRIDRRDRAYSHWFRDYLREIHIKLSENGLITRPVFFTKTDEECFFTRKECSTEKISITFPPVRWHW